MHILPTCITPSPKKKQDTLGSYNTAASEFYPEASSLPPQHCSECPSKEATLSGSSSCPHTCVPHLAPSSTLQARWTIFTPSTCPTSYLDGGSSRRCCGSPYRPCPLPHAHPHAHSRHSGIMHFSAWDVSALHMEPSAGLILTMRCRFFMPIPQVALHSSHSPHSVIRQLLGAGESRGVGVVAAARPRESRPPLPAPQPPGAPLTALLVDSALFRLLGGQRAHGAVLRELLHVPLPGPHAHAAGDAAGRPGDPLRHGAGGAVCNTRAETKKEAAGI